MSQALPHAVLPNRITAVTPSDTDTLPGTCIGLYIGGLGNISVDTLGGDESVVFTGVVAGLTLAGRFKRVNATGTTATNILAFWTTSV